MNPQLTLPATIALPGNARIVRAFGDEAHFHLTGEQTGGNLTLWTNITPPGGGPPPHYHLKEDEWFVIREGRWEFFLDGQWQEMPLGAVVFAPRKVVHSFQNIGDKPSGLLVSTSPSGFETFFSRCAEEFASRAARTWIGSSRSPASTAFISSSRKA